LAAAAVRPIASRAPAGRVEKASGTRTTSQAARSAPSFRTSAAVSSADKTTNASDAPRLVSNSPSAIASPAHGSASSASAEDSLSSPTTSHAKIGVVATMS
jgi:hypothetical protein